MEKQKTAAVVSQSASIPAAFYAMSVSLPASCFSHITIFVSEKAKIAKELLDKKAFAAGRLATGISAAGTPTTATPALQFLQAETPKQVPITLLTELQLLPPRYNFYKRKMENKYLQSA